jgi:hypothetical protein
MRLHTLKPTVFTAAGIVAMLGSSLAFAQEATPAPEFKNFVSTKTRAEVVAETKQAARQNLIPRHEGDTARIAQEGFKPLKTRAQVRAETAEAIRLGLVHHCEAAPPEATAQQLEQIRLAGWRALQADVAFARK